MSCLLDLFSGHNMKNFIRKHMTYKGRQKDHGRKQTSQACTIATLMSLKDGTLSKQRQIIMDDDDELSDISIESVHFDSGVSCNEVSPDGNKLDVTSNKVLLTESTLRIDQIRPLNGNVGDGNHVNKNNVDRFSTENANDHKNIENTNADCTCDVTARLDFDSESCASSERPFTTDDETHHENFRTTLNSMQKHQTLPSKSKSKTLQKIPKPKKASKNYSHSLPNGKKKRKSPGFQKDLKFQGLVAAEFGEGFKNASNITQIYNSCNEKWTTIINLDNPLQSPPAAVEDPNDRVGVIVYGLEDSIESGNASPSDKDRNGRAHVVRWLLWNSAAEMPALERSTSGALALHYASARGCLDCVKLLVETSLDLSANSQMDNDVTPVYLAAQEGHLDVLKFLVLEAGGSLYVRAKDGMAPIHAAAQMGCLGCLKWMVRDQGVDPNLKDGDGATPLHFAASRGHADCVRWLLRYGGKLVADKFGKSPINDAAENQQMECLSLLVQHGTLPDYHEEAKLHGKLHGCVCRKGESTKCSYADCVNYTPSSEPFYLHPPLSSSKPSPASPGLYINPMTNHSHHTNDPFYLHNPQELMYNRVKDLFDSGGNRLQGQQPSSLSSSTSSSPSPPPPPPQPMTVKVEVHSSSSGAGSEESSDLSERGSRNGDHDYEDIYSLQGGGPGTRARSRDSGSHSRSASVSSTNSNVVVTISAPGGTPGNQPCPAPPLMCKMARDDMHTSEESGVSSASPSDLGHSEEEGEKLPQHAQTLKHRNQTNNRMLKRVVSDSGVMVPPPPPPLPDETSMTSSGTSSTEEEQSLDSSATLVEDRPLHRASADTSALAPHTPESGPAPQDHSPSLINKQKALPFIPPKFPNAGDDSNALIKPSEYLKSICGAKQSTLRRSTSEMTLTSDSLRESNKLDVPPPPPPLPPNQDEAKEKQSHQPLATISIQDLNSVQLRRTAAGKTMSVPLTVPGLPTNVPFSNQKNDLIAELKMSRDIIGIKKMKVERVKMEEKQEKEIMHEISRQFSVDVFVDKVGNIPEKDGNGLPIPPWKRQMLAKKAAEKAKKELEEQLAREAEEKRLQSIPAWKRQLMQSKKGDETKTMKPSMHISIEENKPSVIVLEKHSGGESQNYGEENNKENSNPRSETKVDSIPEEAEEDCTPIMPWRSQLRKTNSTLNLLE